MKKSLSFLWGLMLVSPFASSLQAEEPPRVVTLLQELIRADTTNPPGNEIRGAEILSRYLAAIPRLRLELLSSAPGRANLIATLPGTGEAPPLILLGHLDVVPAESEQWSHPPFRGDIAEGYLWGRGAIDMKGMLAMETEAFRELAMAEERLPGDLLLVAVADEEAGGRFGAGWLLHNHSERFRGASVLNEGSIGIRKKEFDLLPIQIAEKGVCWLKLTASGEPGHGSMPHANNAVVKLARAMQTIGEYPFPYQETAIMKQFTQAIASFQPFPTSFLLRHLFSPLIGPPLRWLAGARIGSDRALAAMLRHTATPTELAAGQKINVIPNQATGYVDARILPGMTAERFRDFLQGLVGDEVRLEIITQSLPNESPTDTPLYQALTQVLEEHFPEAAIAPILSAGATDSRFFRAHGMPAYGLIPLLIPEADLAGLHGNDERVPVEQLSRGIVLLKEVVRKTMATSQTKRGG